VLATKTILTMIMSPMMNTMMAEIMKEQWFNGVVHANGYTSI